MLDQAAKPQILASSAERPIHLVRGALAGARVDTVPTGLSVFVLT